MRLFEIKMPEMGDVGEVVVTDVLIQANQHIAFATTEASILPASASDLSAATVTK